MVFVTIWDEMMEYRTFGATGKKISVFTLGTMRFLHGWDQPVDYLPEDSLENAHQVIKSALDAGINLIETAKGYGKSERLIGQTLPRLQQSRADYYLMSKAGSTESAGAMRIIIEQSLKNLGVNHLDFFAIHGINTSQILEMTLQPNGSLTALEQARDEGLIKHLGFSTHAPAEVIIQAIDSGRFEFVNLHYYAFRVANQHVVKAAAQHNMGVFIISPNDKGGLLYHPPEALSQLTAPLHPVNYNERWLLAHPQIHTLSIGMSEKAHVDIHLQSLVGPIWTETEKNISEHIAAITQRAPTGNCGVCTACLPCPQDIDIPEILRLLHLVNCFDMDDYAKYRYGLMVPGNHWTPGAPANTCNQCGECLPRCPAKLPIPNLLLQAHPRMTSWKKTVIYYGSKLYNQLPDWITRHLGTLIGVIRRWIAT